MADMFSSASLSRPGGHEFAVVAEVSPEVGVIHDIVFLLVRSGLTDRMPEAPVMANPNSGSRCRNAVRVVHRADRRKRRSSDVIP